MQVRLAPSQAHGLSARQVPPGKVSQCTAQLTDTEEDHTIQCLGVTVDDGCQEERMSNSLVAPDLRADPYFV